MKNAIKIQRHIKSNNHILTLHLLNDMHLKTFLFQQAFLD